MVCCAAACFAEDGPAAVPTVVRCAGYSVVSAGRRTKPIQEYKPFAVVAAPDRSSAGTPAGSGSRPGSKRPASHGVDPAEAQRWSRFYLEQLRSRPPVRPRNGDSVFDGDAPETDSIAENWGWLSREASAPARSGSPDAGDGAGSTLEGYSPWQAPTLSPERRSAAFWPLSAPMRPGRTDHDDDIEAEDLPSGLWKAGKR